MQERTDGILRIAGQGVGLGVREIEEVSKRGGVKGGEKVKT